jgi:hypothetical protein
LLLPPGITVNSAEAGAQLGIIVQQAAPARYFRLMLSAYTQLECGDIPD